MKHCIHTQNRLIHPKKNPPKKGEIKVIFGEFFTIFNRFSCHDLAAAKKFPSLFSLKFVDPAVILVKKKIEHLGFLGLLLRFFRTLTIPKLQNLKNITPLCYKKILNPGINTQKILI